MKKVFLGIADKNLNLVSRFLENFGNEYELTLGFFSNRYGAPFHRRSVNLNFLGYHEINRYDKLVYMEELIKGNDLVVSNNIFHLSKAAENLHIPFIQYSDMFMYHELGRNNNVAFGSLAKSTLTASVLSSNEKSVYDTAIKNYIYNPLTFFHTFNSNSTNYLCPYYKSGQPQEILEELAISYSANKNLITKDSVNLSAIEDFGYLQIDFASQDYYNALISSREVTIDIDYLLLGDCLFNNIRPTTRFLTKNTSNYFLYNYSRVLNLSKVIDSLPFAKYVDETIYPTLDEIILEHL